MFTTEPDTCPVLGPSAGTAATAIPTPEELIARAEAFRPSLVARQLETELLTRYPDDVHTAFSEAGFYRIMVPRRYGGYEYGLDTFLKVAMALARGCPSTGWMYCLGAAHALAAATLFGPEAQAGFFETGEFICPAVVAPGGTARRTEDGGWEIDGAWPYSSGAPYATHLMGHAMIVDDGEPRPLLFVAPRRSFTVLDDWGDQLGLKGSGSNTIALDHARIPGHCGLEGAHLSEIVVTDGTPGLTLHGNPQYGGAPLSSMALEGAALAVGMAQGALDAYEEILRTKTTLAPPITPRMENPDYQRWYGQAVGMVAAAESITLDTVRRWQDLCAAGPAAFTLQEDLKLALICREAAELAWRALAEIIQPTAGTGSVRSGQRLERIWRDLSTGHSHAGFAVLLTTVISRAVAQLSFGVLPGVAA
ncbi:acyl-CoA dehydrogenase family protein [Catenulispora subtropica]